MTFNYVSVDIETSGLNPDIHQILEIGIVLDNLQTKVSRDELDDYVASLPSLTLYLNHNPIIGDPYALSMPGHQKILKTIAEKGENVVFPEYAIENIYNFLVKYNMILPTAKQNNKVVVAGKNFAAFDLQFLNKLGGIKNGRYFKFHHRVIDPVMIYMTQEDTLPPDLQTCLQRAGIESTVAHNAIDDAKDVIRLLKLKSFGN